MNTVQPHRSVRTMGYPSVSKRLYVWRHDPRCTFGRQTSHVSQSQRQAATQVIAGDGHTTHSSSCAGAAPESSELLRAENILAPRRPTVITIHHPSRPQAGTAHRPPKIASGPSLALQRVPPARELRCLLRYNETRRAAPAS